MPSHKHPFFLLHLATLPRTSLLPLLALCFKPWSAKTNTILLIRQGNLIVKCWHHSCSWRNTVVDYYDELNVKTCEKAGKTEKQERTFVHYFTVYTIFSTPKKKTSRAYEVQQLPFIFGAPSEDDAFRFTVVASALFCLCCRYWAFCFQTCSYHGMKRDIYSIS